MGKMTFSPVALDQEKIILKWLHKPHVNEWFHGVGLQDTIEGLRDFLSNRNPQFDPWIVCLDGEPFAFLITFDVKDEEANDPECHFAKWIEVGRKSITLDLLIGEESYLGKGLSTQMIQDFLTDIHPDKEIIFIDPEATNTKAIHVYQKAGFEKIDDFIASWHPVPHILMRLRRG